MSYPEDEPYAMERNFDGTNKTLHQVELLTEMGYKKFIEFLPLTIILLVLTIIGLVGNICVCIFYGYKSHKTTFSRLIVVIAVVDAIICLLTPQTIVDFWFTYRFENFAMCKLHRFMKYFTTCCSGFLILTISWFRFRMVAQPLKQQFTLMHANIAAVTAMVVSVVLSIPVVILSEPVPYDINMNKTTTLIGCDCGWSENQSLQKYIFATNLYMFLGFIFCLIALCTLYGIMVYKIIEYRKMHVLLRGETAKLSFYDKTSTIRKSIKTSTIKRYMTKQQSTKHEVIISSTINDRPHCRNSKDCSDIYESSTTDLTESSFIENPKRRKTLKKSKSEGDADRGKIHEFILNALPNSCIKTMDDISIKHRDSDTMSEVTLVDNMELNEDRLSMHSAKTLVHQETATEIIEDCDSVIIDSADRKKGCLKLPESGTNGITKHQNGKVCNNTENLRERQGSTNEEAKQDLELSKMVSKLAKKKVGFNNEESSSTARCRTSSQSVIEATFRRNSMLSASAVNQKLTLMLLSITVVFVLSFLPYFIEIFTRDSNEVRTGVLAFWRQFLQRTYLLNSALNPFIYGLFNYKFKKFVKTRVLCCFCWMCKK